MLLDTAAALGARHIKVGDLSDTSYPMQTLIREFSMLCRQAADHGVGILLELMPYSIFRDLDDSLALCRGAAAPNGGIIFDLWHVYMLGLSYEDIESRLTRDDFFGVELNDGPATIPADLADATLNQRLLCGQGEFDIRGFIELVDRFDYKGPWGIEVLNRDLREQPLEEIMKQTFDTTINEFRDETV